MRRYSRFGYIILFVMLSTILTSCFPTVSYTINFDSMGGTVLENITVVSGQSIDLPIPEKEGHTFEGWYLDDDFGTTYTFSKMQSENTTLYAKWTINQYTITFNTYENHDPLKDILLDEDEIIVSASLGLSYSSAITSTGRVFMWGYNVTAQLGDGTTTNRHTPTEITSNFNLSAGETIVSVILSRLHSAAITSTGRVLMWGMNDDGTATEKRTPIEITSNFHLSADETIVSVSLKLGHFAAITSTGRIFMWGSNAYAQLGDGTTTNRLTPIEITSNFHLSADETIVSVSLGHYHSSAITSTGRIFMWGYNWYGELGDGGTTTNIYTPTEITSNFHLSAGETIVSVSLGERHSAAITSTGRVFMWGSNSYGQLGDGTTTDRNTPTEITSNFHLSVGETIVSVSLGRFFSSAIASTGRVIMWGTNLYGELGDGTTTDSSTPTEITENFHLSADETIVSVSLGGFHCSAITSTGRVFMWGRNYHGQLGDGTTTDRHAPQTLTFVSAHSVETISFDYNESLVDYVPTREGHTFDGWYSDASLTNLYIFTTMPAIDITLYGKWIPNQ